MLTSKTFGAAVTNDAFAAVWNADNDRALALLHNVDAPGCAAMRAWVWLRLGRFERVIAEYDRRALASYQPPEATVLACSGAVAYASFGEVATAWDALRAADAAGRRKADPLLNLQCSFTSALVNLLAGNVEESRVAIGALSAIAAAHADVEVRTPYQWELAHIRARIFQHEGRHYELRHDGAAAERCFLRALVAAESAHSRDRFLEAQLLALLSGIIAESPAQSSREYVLSRALGTPWSSHIDESGTYVKHALLNNQRLFATNPALDSLRVRSAPSLASRLGERVCALLIEDWPDRVAFYDESRFAVSLALDIDWAATPEYEVMHLARLSVLLAPFEPTLARKMANRYETRLSQLAPNCATLLDPRRAPLEIFLDACFAKADGKASRAADLFGRAAELWANYGSTWRAAVAGLERFALSAAPADLETARAFAEAYPASSFSRRLRRALEVAVAGTSPFPYLGLYRTAAMR